MSVSNGDRPRRLPVVFWCSLAVSVALILININQWTLANNLPFIHIYIETFAGHVFLAVMLWASVYAMLGFRRYRFKAALPLGVQVFTLWILATVPFTHITLDLDFRLNLKGREKAVAMVKSGKLKSRSSYNRELIQLPPGLQHLSQGGGEILVDDPDEPTMVLFFTYRGVLDNFAGFIYSSDAEPPHPRALGGDFKEIEKIQPHWFWASSS